MDAQRFPIPVETEACFSLVAPDAALPVRAGLRYDPADPYAVHVIFHADAAANGETVSWSFARELLVTGLDEPAGIGDVRVWPWTTPRGDFVALALSSPDGNALFQVPRSALMRFLSRTYAAVPRGQESDYLDIDAALIELFS